MDNIIFKKLIYDGVIYDNFEINIMGEIKNVNTGHTYKPHICMTGYNIVTLPMGKRGIVKSIRIHKAIAETFIKNPYPNLYDTVHHKDGNKLNNNIDNLEWTTRVKNTQIYYSELYKKNEFGNNRKLTKDDVIFIREHYKKNGYSLKTMAKMFNVSKTTIIDICKHRIYKNCVAE